MYIDTYDLESYMKKLSNDQLKLILYQNEVTIEMLFGSVDLHKFKVARSYAQSELDSRKKALKWWQF